MIKQPCISLGSVPQQVSSIEQTDLWPIARQGESCGPMEIDEALDLVRPGDQIAQPGMDHWLKMSEVEVFRDWMADLNDE